MPPLTIPEHSSPADERASAWQRAALDWLLNFNSENTRRNYRRAINAFFAFCPAAPDVVTQSDVLRYRHALEQAGYDATTINLRLAGLSSFYKFAVERGLRADNPCDGVKRKAVNPYGKATFLDGQRGQDIELLNSVDRKTEKGRRDYAILLLLLTTAVRVDAVAGLRLSDLRIQGEAVYMQYRNKGGEIVEKRLQPVVVRALNDYFDTRPEVSDDSPLFALTARGKRGTRNLFAQSAVVPSTEQPLSVTGIERVVRRYADKAFGPGHGITPHSLRHTAAMNAVMGGASVIEVARLLRHKSLRVTTVYIQHISDKADDSISEKLGRRYE